MKDVKKTATIEKPAAAAKSAATQSNDLGAIKISDSVISCLVRKAALGVDGVSRLAGSTFVDNIAEIVGSRKMSDRSIAITMEEDKVEIEIKVNIKFGYKVPEVAAAIQSAVIEQVENITGMNVTCVNVIVQEIEDVQEDESEAAEENSAAMDLDK